MKHDQHAIESNDLAATISRLQTLSRSAGRGEADRFGSYHNHTTWSHGRYKPEELVERALALGFAELGITDHAYTNKGGINCVRNEQISAYRAMIDELKLRYQDNIRIYAGLEIDTSGFNPNRMNLPFEALEKLDYVFFEYVGETSWGGYTLNELLAARRKLSCGAGLAHPNMPLLITLYGAVTLARSLAENDIFIDACGSARNSRPVRYERPGISREYTLNIEEMGDEFKDAAREYGVEFLPSTDTHQDDQRDALSSTVNAIATIIRYDFPRKTFDAVSQAEVILRQHPT
jgi:hypothetical protein